MYNGLGRHKKTNDVHTFGEVKQLLEGCTAEKRRTMLWYEHMHHDDIVTLFSAAKYCAQTICNMMQVIDTDILTEMFANKAEEDVRKRAEADYRSSLDGN